VRPKSRGDEHFDGLIERALPGGAEVDQRVQAIGPSEAEATRLGPRFRQNAVLLGRRSTAETRVLWCRAAP